MLKDITIGQFFPGSSVLHRLDPRMKLVLTVLYITSIFLCANFLSMGVILISLTGLIILSGIPVKTVLKSVKPLIPILILTALLNMFYVEGKILAQWWIFRITAEGIQNAIFTIIRITCLIVSGSMLTYTTSPTSLTDAIERLLSPLKIFRIEVHSIAMMMTIALRFIPTLIEEIDKIMNAQKARGADLESGNLFQRIRAMIPILIPLFVSSFRRAYELAFAMECRCYRGGKGRTRMKQMRLVLQDYLALFVVLAMISAIVLLNHFFDISLVSLFG